MFLIFFFFFFQAEDGIRDATVTGVQTCALPIYPHVGRQDARDRPADECTGRRSDCADGRHDRYLPIVHPGLRTRVSRPARSEERRVGKEWRFVWGRQETVEEGLCDEVAWRSN